MHDQDGAERVAAVLDGALVSAVNWSQVVHTLLQRGADVEGLLEDMSELGVRIEPFTAAQADASARRWASTRNARLSPGDRACLSLAAERALPALTGDRAWAALSLHVRVDRIR